MTRGDVWRMSGGVMLMVAGVSLSIMPLFYLGAILVIDGASGPVRRER